MHEIKVFLQLMQEEDDDDESQEEEDYHYFYLSCIILTFSRALYMNNICIFTCAVW